MNTYFLVCTLVLIAALLLMWRTSRLKQAPDLQAQDKANIAIYRQEQARLDALPEPMRSRALQDLERSVYEDLKREAATPLNSDWQHLPLGAALLILLVPLSCFIYYFSLMPNDLRQWIDLRAKLTHNSETALYTGQLPSLPHTLLAPFCLVMQSRLMEHAPHDPYMLDVLGQCYAALGEMSLAKTVHERALFYAPNNPDIRMHTLQAQILAGDPLSPAAEEDLRRQYANERRPIAALLLALAYRQAGREAEALQLWHDLQEMVPSEHPMSSIIRQNIAELETQKTAPAALKMPPIRVTLADDLPNKPQATLFVLLKAEGMPAPIAVKKLAFAAQTMTFSTADIMLPNGKVDLRTYPKLAIHALVSSSGNAFAPDPDIIATPVPLNLDKDVDEYRIELRRP